jgi:hypothetical protein
MESGTSTLSMNNPEPEKPLPPIGQTRWRRKFTSHPGDFSITPVEPKPEEKPPERKEDSHE